ncbi:Flp family type IVb pilin [Methylobrevis albus]|uniref:Flp/Fap pilin component n=1 Tax=Methylobrevis albus TaxID=2793297 RepID=A0A931I0U4_9HYPH|nr:hypothetical protein [Methylobrevis albus]MBH0237349.1 hypothetical protein [Methylobrevis albus]
MKNGRVEDSVDGHGRAAAGRVRRFACNRSGTVAIEYGMLMVMVAIFILAVASLGDFVSEMMFDDLAATMQNANEGKGG